MPPTATTATTTTAPQATYLNKKAFKGLSTEKYAGPSPYATKPSDKSTVEFTGGLTESGALDAAYEFEELTPVIGREYPDAQLSDILKDPELLRDLAITISKRGVVFFKAQELTIDQQKQLADELGRVTGKPESSGLHIHPIAPAGGFLKEGTEETDPEVSIISSKLNRKIFKSYTSKARKHELAVNRDTGGWHSDITFEPVPADYTILKIVETPPTGGDTLFASGNGVYDLLSESFRTYLGGLTGTYTQPHFKESSEESGFDFYTGPRGNPENVGDELTAEHPIIRTNPVTGWNSVFAVGEHYTKVNEVSPKESALISEYIQELVFKNHDIRVRYKWLQNSVAIWDNRSVLHNATRDIYKLPNEVNRLGVRTVGIGERPFFDKRGKSRAEALEEEEKQRTAEYESN